MAAVKNHFPAGAAACGDCRNANLVARTALLVLRVPDVNTSIPSPAGKHQAPARRLLLAGWDSADWQIIHPLMDRGELPGARALAITALPDHMIRTRAACGYEGMLFRANAETARQTPTLAARFSAMPVSG